MSAQPAVRRAPLLAAVEFCYAIFQIKEDRSFMTRLEQITFDWLFMPVARFGFRHLHWPIFEKLDKLKCEKCGHVNIVENGGRWTEKTTVVTTRDLAICACKGKTGAYWHRLPVNALGNDATLRTHRDHVFPNSPGAAQYEKLSCEVETVNRVGLEQAHCRGSELLDQLAATNR
jgi:hypothetical protein